MNGYDQVELLQILVNHGTKASVAGSNAYARMDKVWRPNDPDRAEWHAAMEAHNVVIHYVLGLTR